MEITRENLDSIALYPFRSESELMATLQEFIRIYNFERERIPELYDSEQGISAYLYYFFATNVPKGIELLKRIYERQRLSFESGPVIDIGMGPGSFLVSWLKFFPDFSNEVIGVDTADLMVEQAHEIFKTYFPNIKTTFKNNYRDVERKENATLCFTHSFNEMSEGEFMKILDYFKPERLLFMEPGTHEVFHKLKAIREKLINDLNYQVAYPCFSQATCPISLDSEDWCHQYVDVRHEVSIERLTQKLNKDRRNMPTIFHVYHKKNLEGKVDKSGIIFRILKETKFSYDFIVCSQIENSNQLRQVRLLKKQLKARGVSKKVIKSFIPGTDIKFKIVEEKNAFTIIELN
ncbi:MAG: hypothetical protein H6621_01430 [Halobacteriovoraceae bacterium]|nr:hypothetical protein [Halobacteriovoraceae bacterium]